MFSTKNTADWVLVQDPTSSLQSSVDSQRNSRRGCFAVGSGEGMREERRGRERENLEELHGDSD